MNLYKSLIMKAGGFSCPYLYWGVSIKSLTKCVSSPTAQAIRDALPSWNGCQWQGEESVPTGPGDSGSDINLSNTPWKLGRRRPLTGLPTSHTIGKRRPHPRYSLSSHTARDSGLWEVSQQHVTSHMCKVQQEGHTHIDIDL
jgi:hypothetical protein